MSQFTSVFQLEFLAPGEPVRNTRAIMERNARTIEAALLSRNISPPGASDLITEAGTRRDADAALATRATNLESRATSLETSRTALGRVAPVDLAYYSPWVAYDANVFHSLRVWKEGVTGFAVGMVKASAAVAAGDQPIVGIPAGMRPGRYTPAAALIGGTTVYRADVRPNGDLVVSMNAGVNAGVYVAINMVWPCI
jgi:hypothetical protein